MVPVVETIEEYNFCLERGHDPIVSSHFKVEHKLRIKIQKQIFGRCLIGRGDIPKANQRYYYYMWENKPHICENCSLPLQSYSACFISHIYTKGAYPEMAHDPRNCNILCMKCHEKWENGYTADKIGMRIYPSNSILMRNLVTEYQNKKVV